MYSSVLSMPRRFVTAMLLALCGMYAFGQSPKDSLSVPSPNDSLKAEFEKLEALTAAADTSAFALPINLTKPTTAVKTPTPEVGKGSAKLAKTVFTPNPQRALWLSLIVPGAGQIYNRKYWKLPLVYGGFLGCTYAFLWNQQVYMDYSQAYLDIMDSDPLTQSYKNMFPPSYDIEGNKERFKTIFKNRKDRFRRYRDMSVFAFIGVYLLSVVDAYVDAQLSVFDISPDLSLHLSPATFESRDGLRSTPTLGLGATLTF